MQRQHAASAALVAIAIAVGLPFDAARAEEPAAARKETDHGRMVKHVGLRVFSTGAAAAVPAAALSLQTIGVRYWLQRSMGLEGGIGVGFLASTQGGASLVSFGIQAGVPLVLAEAKHLSIHVAPFVSMSVVSVGAGPATPSARVGANLAAELQFGFIDVPQLSVQAQFGAALVVNELGRDTIGFTTTVGPGFAPLDILTGSINATWYLGE